MMAPFDGPDGWYIVLDIEDVKDYFPIWTAVIAGLDPAIHLATRKMDARVKPGHDSSGHPPSFSGAAKRPPLR
jgi:hypothetical protein